MPSILARGLRSVDYFGFESKLLIDKSSKYKTITGGLISILVYILITAGFIDFGKELVLKSNPKVVTTSLFQANPGAFELTNKNFNFFVGLQDSNSNYFMDPTIAQVSMKLNSIQKQIVNGTVKWIPTYRDLKPMQCDLNKNFPYFQEEFSNQPLSSLYCIDSAEFNNLSLAGSAGEDLFSYISTAVTICTNSTDSDIICKSHDEIESALSGAYFVVDFIDTLFQPQNFSNPKQYFRRHTYTTISIKYYKEMAFNFKHVEFNTDKGAIIEDISTRNYLQLDYEKEMYDFRSETTGIILNCTFRISNQKDVYNRSYIKIRNVLAMLGGLINSLFIIVQILYSNFSKVGYYFSLWENLFEVKDSEDSDAINLTNNVFMHRNNNTSFSIQKIYLNKAQKISESMIEKKFDKKKTNFSACLKHGFLRFCLNSKKRITMNKPFDKIANYIEVKTDIKRLLLNQEKFEFMKDVLLTGDQVNIFDYYTKKIDLNQCNNFEIPDKSSVVKSYESISSTRQNKVGDRLRLYFEKKYK